MPFPGVGRGMGRTSRLSGDLTVASCMTPKVRSLDGVVCMLLCVGLHPCRLHVVLHKMSNLPDLQKRRDRSDEGGFWNKSTEAPKPRSDRFSVV